MEMMNLEIRGDANSSAKAAQEVSEKALVAMLEHSAQSVEESSVSRPVVVPKVTISKLIQLLFSWSLTTLACPPGEYEHSGGGRDSCHPPVETLSG